jgi:hypothetical protein
MVVKVDPLARLEASIADVSDVYVIAGTDANAYYARLTKGLRAAVCDPFEIRATVEAPGFPDAGVGTVIDGQCVAHANGEWLVYQEKQDRFVQFWGTVPGKLTAPGIFGSPLGCWSA